MDEILQKLYADRKLAVEKMESLVAEAGDELMTDEQTVSFDESKADISTIDKKIKVRQDLEEAKKHVPAVVDINQPTGDEIASTVSPSFDGPSVIKVPAQYSRLAGKIKSFAGESFKGMDKMALCYKAGMFFKATMGHRGAYDWCMNQGIGAALNEGTNTAGGYLVFDELDTAIIDLRNDYGLFRQKARVVNMGSDVTSRPRKTGRVSASFVGEGVAGTESNTTWDLVKLVAKKLMVLTAITNELNSDAIISVTDDLIQDMGLAFATKEDDTGFKGTGISTDGGIVGAKTRLTDVNGVDNGGGVILGAGNLFSELTLANHQDTIGRLPQYSKRGAEWYCSNTYLETVMNKLAMAAGGTQPFQIIDGQRRAMFLGYPVNLTESMPVADANSQIVAIFGNLPQAADFGNRAGTTIAFTTDATIGSNNVFEKDMMGVRATMRMDINIHDVGTATVAGPIVGLISASS